MKLVTSLVLSSAKQVDLFFFLVSYFHYNINQHYRSSSLPPNELSPLIFILFLTISMKPLYSNKQTPKAIPHCEVSPKFTANPFAKLPNSPMFSRKSSHSKRQNQLESAKSSGQKSLQKSIKYTKIVPSSYKKLVTQVHSEVHIIDLLNYKNQDCSETVYRPRSKSKNHSEIFFATKKRSNDKSQGRSMLEMSGYNASKKSKGVKAEDNYVYWKNKAHQYLELNMKLMNDVRKLTKENQRLKNTLAECQESLNNRKISESTQLYNQMMLSKEIRNISAIYMTKIQGMERELKRKEMIVASYEIKMEEMGTRLAGDIDRIKLISRLQQQIQHMREELFSKKKHQPMSFQTESTSILTCQSIPKRPF